MSFVLQIEIEDGADGKRQVSIVAGHPEGESLVPTENPAQILAALDIARSIVVSGVKFSAPKIVRASLVPRTTPPQSH